MFKAVKAQADRAIGLLLRLRRCCYEPLERFDKLGEPTMPARNAAISSRVTVENPRPRKYASAAERQKALRERFPTLCVRVEQEQADFMKRIADEQGRTLQDVHLAFIKYAGGRGNLWLTQGLKGFAPLPRFEEPKENPMKRKPTPAQIAARERFAEMARSGAFKRKAKRNPAKKTVSQKISQLTREGYPQKQAVAIALSEERAGKVKRNPISGQEAGEFRMTVNGKSVTRFFAHDNDAWANSYGFNYRLLSNVVKVGSPVRFTKTRAIVAIDEAADGSPVTETWEIRDLKFYKTNPRAANPIILVSDKPVKRRKNPMARKSNGPFYYALVPDDGGFSFGMDSRTPVQFVFSNRDRTRGIYRSFALPNSVTSNPEFQQFASSLPGNSIVASLDQLRNMLRKYA